MSKPGLHVGNNPDGSRIEVPFEVCAADRARQLQAELAAYVDANFSPADREGMSAMLQQITLSIVIGEPPPSPNQAWALGALFGALAWARSALALGGALAAQCAACETVEALDGVVLDVSSIGPPPNITAGEIAAALMP